jgi:hypothetical protein
MNAAFKLFAFLYMFAPLIVVPFIAYKFDNWYILFGILFSYLGATLAANKPKWFYPLPLFCIGFWVAKGFNIHQYVTLFFFFALGGFIFYQIADEYDKSRMRNSLEFKAQVEHLEKIKQQIAERIAQYQHANPDVELTNEIIENIKQEVFFSLSQEDLKKIDKL